MMQLVMVGVGDAAVLVDDVLEQRPAQGLERAALDLALTIIGLIALPTSTAWTQRSTVTS